MPSVDDNLSTWEGAGGDWWEQGDEWSGEWGGAVSQWNSMLLPRVGRFFPTGRLVEIAPGFGRWTQFLLPLCSSYIGVDLTPRCVETCRQRFADVTHAEFHQNDGRSIPMVQDRSADVVFSFDSLVHVEMDVLRAYVKELARVLDDDGVAFIHHSNAGTVARTLERNRPIVARRDRIPGPVQRGLEFAGLLDRDHWRALGPTAAQVSAAVSDAGLQCVTQELVPWGVRRVLLDSFTVITRPGSQWSGPPQVVENPDFMAEARSAARIAKAYPQAG